jgi:hypothetical protein
LLNIQDFASSDLIGVVRYSGKILLSSSSQIAE